MVLTAAHCLVRDGGAFEPGELVVGYGSVYRSKLQKVAVEVSRIRAMKCRKTTSACSSSRRRSRTPRPLNSPAAPRKGCCAGPAKARPLTLTVSGWGKLWDIRPGELAAQLHGLGVQNLQAVQAEIMSPEQLRKADLQEIAQQDCALAYGAACGTNAVDLDGNICTMGTVTRKASCQGDSGGPLFAISSEGPVQVGVVSWGHSCADDLFPGIYTLVASHADWIANTMSAETQAVSR